MHQVKLFSKAVGLCFAGILLTSFSMASSFQGLGTEPEGYIRAEDVSSDGSVVVGSASWEAFRWTRENGIVKLQPQPDGSSSYYRCSACCVSPDGTIINISCEKLYGAEAFRWTDESGIVSLFGFGSKYDKDDLIAASADGFTVIGCWDNTGWPQAFRWSQSNGEFEDFGYDEMVNDITEDGSIVVGYKGSAVYKGSDGDSEACIWTSESGMIPIGLGHLAGSRTSSATAVSADGSVVVGESGQRAFHWTQDGGMVSLGVVSGTAGSTATDVSGDGNVIVGNSIDPGGVFVWDEKSGINDLQGILTNTYHLNLTGWQLTETTAISTDGKTIIGQGTNPDGNEESWIVSMDACSGTLMVGIEPDEAVSAGAKWRVDEGIWLDAEQVHSCLSVGNHTIEFKAAAGWILPESQTVEVFEGQQTITSGQYMEADNNDNSSGCFIGTMPGL